MLRIYDSRTRALVPLAPSDPERGVRVYWCGPTVYDHLHIGHARAAIVPDMVRRWLEASGHLVRYVANFTDVDDKIIARSIATGRPWREITQHHIDEYHRLMVAIGNRPADVHPRATDHVPEMRDLVARLIARDHAYVAADGDVYFDTKSLATYGALSHRDLDAQESQGRIGEGRLAVKRQPADFILWKLLANDPEAWKQAGPRSVPGWDSPWGKGRPGWHLECSVLSRQYLGMPFDIHGGGMDLLFPHHENERAQNEGGHADELCGHESVRIWMHNAFIRLRPEDTGAAVPPSDDGEDPLKMSKSKGNVVWLHELIWPAGSLDPMALRLMVLSSHYRSPIDYHAGMLAQHAAYLDRVYGALEALGQAAGATLADGEPPDAVAAATRAFADAMDDDFGTPKAIAAWSPLVSGAAAIAEAGPRAAAHAKRALEGMMRTLGLRVAREVRASAEAEKPLLDLVLELRKGARATKQFAVSDRIRDALTAMKYELRDRPDGGTDVTRG